MVTTAADVALTTLRASTAEVTSSDRPHPLYRHLHRDQQQQQHSSVVLSESAGGQQADGGGLVLMSSSEQHSIRQNDSRLVSGVGRVSPTMSGTPRVFHHRQRNGVAGGTSFRPTSLSSVGKHVSGAEALMRRTSPYRLSDIVHGGASRVHSLTTVAVITAIFVAITLGTTILVAAVCCRHSRSGCRRRKRQKRTAGSGGDCELNEFNDDCVSDDEDGATDNDEFCAGSSSRCSLNSTDNRKCGRVRDHVTRSRSESSAMALLASNSRSCLLNVDDGALSLRRSADSSTTTFQFELNGGSEVTLGPGGVEDGGKVAAVDGQCVADNTDCSDDDEELSSARSSRLTAMFRPRQNPQPCGYRRLASQATDQKSSCFSISRSVDEMTSATNQTISGRLLEHQFQPSSTHILIIWSVHTVLYPIFSNCC